MRRPDFFIVGAAKCGTTALEAYLGSHPDVFMSPLKEPHYFGSDLPFADRAPFSEAEYLAHFAGAHGERRIGEKSVWYLYSKRAAAEIKEFSPNARIIIMLRNPVDQMYSLYWDRRFQGSEAITDFEAALRAEPSRRRGLDLPRRGMRENVLYRAIASFPEQVARYFDAFGRENVHVIILDDLKTDAAAVYVATLEFLDVSPVPDARLRPKNIGRQVRSSRVARLLHTPPGFVVRLGRAILSRPARVGLAARMRRLNSRQARPPSMPVALRRRLQDEFAPEVERLGRMLDRDLSHWSRH
jgi:sulfotransferase family protein